MDKSLNHLVTKVKALKIQPNSINVCGRLIQAYMENCNFETMTRLDWLEWYNNLDDMMIIYWKIRGR